MEKKKHSGSLFVVKCREILLSFGISIYEHVCVCVSSIVYSNIPSINSNGCSQSVRGFCLNVPSSNRYCCIVFR